MVTTKISLVLTAALILMAAGAHGAVSPCVQADRSAQELIQRLSYQGQAPDLMAAFREAADRLDALSSDPNLTAADAKVCSDMAVDYRIKQFQLIREGSAENNTTAF